MKLFWILGLASYLAAVPAYAQNPTFDKNCKSCHPSSKGLAKKVPGKSFEERAADLDAFLQKHHAGDPVVRAEMIGWLLLNPVE